MNRATRFRSRLRVLAVLRLLTAGYFLAFVVAQSPHLVHHLFRSAQKQADCPFASAAERTEEVTADVFTLIPWLGPETERWVFCRSHLGSLALVPARARPPPLVAS